MLIACHRKCYIAAVAVVVRSVSLRQVLTVSIAPKARLPADNLLQNQHLHCRSGFHPSILSPKCKFRSMAHTGQT